MTDTYFDQSYPPSLFGPVIPTLVTISPTTAVINTPITIQCVGTNFTSSSKVYAGATLLTTTFTDSGHISASYTTPATAQSVSITVKDGSNTTSARTLTVTATELQSTETPPEENTYTAIPVEEPPPNTE